MTVFDSPYDQSYPPSLWDGGGGPTPDKGSASPSDVFPAEATITAEDATNAAKLAGLGYVADPQTAWAVGSFMTVGTFRFSWTGTAWRAGPAVAAATGVTAGTPGSFTPAGAMPANITELRARIPTPTPSTAWTTGQYVVIGTGNAYWNGTDWAMGIAP